MDFKLADWRSHIREGAHFFKRRMFQKTHKRYDGSAAQIIKQTLRNNFNGKFFQCGQGNHRMFYVRDIFGIATDGLLDLGMESQLRKTLETVLSVYKKAGKITTSINTHLHAVDVFEYGSDSLSGVLRVLRLTESDDLVKKYEPFLNEQIAHYEATVVDPKTGIVKADQNFSTTKDNTLRQSPLYANISMLVVEEEIKRLNARGHHLYNPFHEKKSLDSVIETFWMEEKGCFRDVPHLDYVAADQIFFPFYDIPIGEEKTASLIDAIIAEGLADPLPLQYTKQEIPETKNHFLDLFAKNYQGDTIWTMLGVPFLSVLDKRNDPRLLPYLKRYEEIIEHDQSCIELYNSDLSKYWALGYMYGEGMSWFAPLYKVLQEHETELHQMDHQSLERTYDKI